MKQKGIILALLVASGVTLLAVRLQSLPDPQPPEAPAKQAHDTNDRRVSPASPLPRVIAPASSPNPGARAANIDRLVARGYIPAEYRDLWLDPDYERIAEERFNVIPKTVRKPGDTCDLLGVDDSHICWNDYGYHPYLAYQLQQLEAMAETDAVAAEALAMRLPAERLEDRLYYSLKAARLSGKSGPVMRFVYSYAPSPDDPEYFARMLDRYSLALLGERMGYPYRYSLELEQSLMKEFGLSREQLYRSLDQRRVELFDAGEGQS